MPHSTEETLSRIVATWASSEKKPEVISFEMGVVKVLRARKSSGGTGLPAAQTYKAWDQQDRTGLNHLLRLAKTSEAGGGRLSGRKVRLLATAWVDGELLVDLKSFELQVTAKSTQLLGTAAERSTRASIEDESYHVVRTGEGLEVQWRFKTKEQFAEWATGVLNLLYDPDNNSGAAEGDGKQLLGILETLAGISGGVERINQRSHKLVMRIKAKVVHAKNSLASMVPTLTNSATTLLLEWRDAAEERFDLLEGRVTGVEKGLEEERRTRAAETEEIRRRLDEKDELDAARDALLNQHGMARPRSAASPLSQRPLAAQPPHPLVCLEQQLTILRLLSSCCCCCPF